MAKWSVVAEPIGENPGLKPDAGGRKRRTGTKDEKKAEDNVGGIVVSIAREGGGTRQEVSRVGFIRKTSENPKDGFDAKLKEVVGIAQTSVDTMNDLEEKATGDLV